MPYAEYVPSRRLPVVWGIYGVLLLVLYGAATAVMSRYLTPAATAFIAGAGVLGLLLGYGCLWLRYRRMTYTLTETALTVRSGVWYRTVRQVPLASIRYITRLSGPPERLAGICHLLIFLPGGTVMLEGVPVAEAAALQERLLFREVHDD